MIEECIVVNFVYLDGKREELKDEHIQEYEEGDEFETSTQFIKSIFGSVEIITNDVPNITNMSSLEHYEYTEGSREIDLLYSPLVKYVLGEPQYLEGGDNHPKEPADTYPLEQFVELVEIGYQAAEQQPLAVYAEVPKHDFIIHQTGQPPFTAESLAHDKYHHLSWLTIFTPPMVERYGRETLLSAPAWKVEELDDGAILVVCHDDVSEWKEDGRDVAEHIGLPWYEDIV